MVTSASFYRLPNGTLAVFCSGVFPHRALPLTAKVGDVDVEGISISPGSQSFMGVLRKSPRVGAELVVRFPPEPPIRTGVTVPSPNVA